MNSLNRKKNVSLIIYILTIALSALLIWLGHSIVMRAGIPAVTTTVPAITAKVTAIVKREADTYSLDGSTSIDCTKIIFRAKVTSGNDRGKEITAYQTNDAFMAQDAKEVQPGDKVVLDFVREENSDIFWTFGEYVRTDKLMILGVVFLLLLIIFGRKKGFNTILSLAFTLLAIFAVFIPSILAGFNVYLMCALTCIFVTVMSLLIIGGVGKKTISAILGCIGGLLFACGLTLLMSWVLGLTGMVDDNAVYLQFIKVGAPLNLKAITFAAITIGALGAILDVSMSIASSVGEIASVSIQPTAKMLSKSGMQIGRDIMGTMSNTLVLAYIGGGLASILLLIAYTNSATALLNKEMIVVEILQALVGSIGILLTIPLTAWISALLFSRNARTPK
ncbi:MAG: YibE/F family protein [Clostridia bacterium]